SEVSASKQIMRTTDSSFMPLSYIEITVLLMRISDAYGCARRTLLRIPSAVRRQYSRLKND
ncbi:MAG: hypothetical protein QGG54_21785, partial [Gammaproteobacteria bacterium]|nr:hypothetical protein [Gammaproteobacteria bacterium]